MYKCIYVHVISLTVGFQYTDAHNPLAIINQSKLVWQFEAPESIPC